MYVSRQPISSRAADAAGWSLLPGRLALASLLAFALLTLGAIAVPGRAQAANGGPKITFASPIYPGQNNGFAEGPVGANVSVQGSGWTSGGNVTITLADEQNDTAGQPGSACQNGSAAVSIPGLSSQPVDGSGNFTAAFEWPAAAGQKGHSYWACGTQGATKADGVDKFTVLSSNPPSVSITVSQATPGSMIAVTGQNWLPSGVKVIVIVAPCVACGPPYSSNAQVTSSSGSFNVLVQVPPSAPVGTTLYVSAQNTDSANPANSGALTTGTSTAAQFTVVSDTTPTTTPTATPTPSPTPTSTAAATSTTTTNTSGGTNNNTTSGSSGNSLLIVLLAALGVVLLLGAIIAIAFYVRSRGPAPGAGGPPPYGGGGYGPKGGQYGGYGPPSYPDTNDDYYHRPPPRSGPPRQGWGNAGGWQDDYPGPPDDMGDDPTIGVPSPWRR